MTLTVTARAGTWHWEAPSASSIQDQGVSVWVQGLVLDGDRALQGRDAAQELLRRYRRDGGWSSAASLHGAFSAVVADAGQRRALVLTDRFGSRPVYFRRLEDGWRLSDEFARVLPERPAWDAAAALDLLFFGFIPGSATLERSTFECLNRRVYEFRLDPLDMASTPYWVPQLAPPEQGGAEARWRPQMRAALDALMGRTRRLAAQAEGPVCLLLSGGLDTRVLVAALAGSGIEVEAYTYGVGEDEDVRYAAAIAKRLGWPHHVRRITEQELLGPQWDALTAALGFKTQAVAGMGVSLLAEAMGPGPVFTGFGGDLLSGSFLHGAVRAPAAQQVWRTFGRFVDFEALAPAMRPGILELARSRRAAVEEQLIAADPETAVHAWNIDERQRRLILPQCDLPGRQTMLPFAEPAFLDACGEAPRNALYRQQLYRNTLFHDVFTGGRAWLRDVPLVKFHYGVPFHPVSSGWGRWRHAVPDALAQFHYYKQRLGWSKRPVELYSFWRDRPPFRQAAIERLDSAPLVSMLFDVPRLRRLLADNRDYLLAAGGIWSLMTLAACRLEPAGPAGTSPERAHAAAT